MKKNNAYEKLVLHRARCSGNIDSVRFRSLSAESRLSRVPRVAPHCRRCEWQSYRDSRFVSRFCMTVDPGSVGESAASKWHTPPPIGRIDGVKSLVPRQFLADFATGLPCSVVSSPAGDIMLIVMLPRKGSPSHANNLRNFL